MDKGPLYTVREAARSVGVSPGTLRLWERERLIQPRRSPGGRRLFSQEDILRLRRIHYLRRVEKLNLAAIRQSLASNQPETQPAQQVQPPVTPENLGARLRIFRRRQNLTLQKASRLSGLSVSFLSAAERGVTGISLASLLKLTLIYRIYLSDLYGETPAGTRKLVRAGERQIFENPASGVRIEQLTHVPAVLEAQVFLLQPGASSEGAYAHEGEELIYVLEGSLDFTLDEGEYFHIEAGDCLHFPSSQYHRWENSTSKPARLLWVATPPGV